MVESGQHGASTPVEIFRFDNPDRSSLGIEVVSYTHLTKRLPPCVQAKAHRTDFHQIFLITAGHASTMVDFIDYPCGPGILMHVAPGRVLRLPRPTGPDGTLEVTLVLFTPAFLPRIDSAFPFLSPFTPAVWNVKPDEGEQVARAVCELTTEYERTVRDVNTPVDVQLLQHLLAAFVLRLARLAASGGGVATDRQLADANTFLRFQHELERSFAATRNAAEYATRVGYSLRTLNRACQAATGQTAKALIDARVTLEAKRLLIHTNLPVAAVGRHLGFTEPTNFVKFFTRKTSCTPGAFREREHL